MEVQRADIQDLLKAGWNASVCRAAGFLRAEILQPVQSYAGPCGTGIHRRADRRNGYQQPLERLSRCLLENLGDTGFPDRILFHKAVAAKHRYYDISRVGIHGNSAGGQSSMGALLFHPEFSKVAVSNSSCHDNRMDKIWWNEQRMGYPLGLHYAAESNVDNASKLQGKLLLIVGGMDTNVDPSSTLQVANALIKANKCFDLLFVPGGGTAQEVNTGSESATTSLCASCWESNRRTGAPWCRNRGWAIKIKPRRAPRNN